MNHFVELVKSCQVAFQEDRTSVVTSNGIFLGMSYCLPLSLLPVFPEWISVERNVVDVLECVSSRPLNSAGVLGAHPLCIL